MKPVIHVTFRHKAAPGTEAAFPASWEQCKVKMLRRARGLESMKLFQNAQDPTEFVWVTTWASIEDWRAYWSDGVPDPEGDLVNNEVLLELRTLTAPVGEPPKARRLPRRKPRGDDPSPRPSAEDSGGPVPREP